MYPKSVTNTKTRPKTAGTRIKNRPALNLNTDDIGNTNFRQTFFIQEKEKGDPYFRNTRVGSCRKVVVKNEVPFAKTFRITNPRGEKQCHFKYTLKQRKVPYTTYQTDYCVKRPASHCGDRKKPLVPYHPNHPRNMIPPDLDFLTYGNKSKFDVGSPSLINRKQYLSTYMDSYKPHKVYRISNPGIVSDIFKRSHYRFSNIEYGK